MAKNTNLPPAFKVGFHSPIDLLPGEDRDTYREHCRAVFDDFAPKGPIECAIVDEIARLEWRKQNLATLVIAGLAGERRRRILLKHLQDDPHMAPLHERFEQLLDGIVAGRVGQDNVRAWAVAQAVGDPRPRPPTESEVPLEQKRQAAEEEARRELGDLYKLAAIGRAATLEGLAEYLDIVDRIDAKIDKLLKRLLFLKGLKSISESPSLPSPQRRLPEPEEAA